MLEFELRPIVIDGDFDDIDRSKIEHLHKTGQIGLDGNYLQDILRFSTFPFEARVERLTFDSTGGFFQVRLIPEEKDQNFTSAQVRSLEYYFGDGAEETWMMYDNYIDDIHQIGFRIDKIELKIEVSSKSRD